MMEYTLGRSAAHSRADARAAFIRRTYAHLAGAILAFVSLQYVLFNLLPEGTLDNVMLQYLQSRVSHFVLMIAFVGTGYLARRWAYGGTSTATQYVGLGAYVVAQAIIFVPLLWIAIRYLNAPELVQRAGVLTLCLFGGLTAAVLVTRKDFSFLGPVLMIASFLALGFIILGWIFGFTIGLWFSLAMVVLAAGFILYDTSNVLHHFDTDQHVAASLELFASVALMFYYILLVLLNSRSR